MFYVTPRSLRHGDSNGSKDFKSRYGIRSFVVTIAMVPRYKTHPTKTLGWGTLRVFSICGKHYFGEFKMFAGKFQYEPSALEPGGQKRAGLDDGGVAFWAGGDHADFDVEEVGDEF